MMEEKLLRLALIETDECILSQLPSSEEYEHDFSRSFIRKLQKLIRREKYPLFYEIRKIAAAVLIFLTLSAGILMATNESVRAAVLHWLLTIQQNSNGWDSYWYEGNSDLHRNVSDYTLEGFVPEGYKLIDRVDDEIFISEYYIHEDGIHFIFFDVSSPDYGISSGILFDEHTQPIPIIINGYNGLIFLSDLDRDSNSITWTDEDGVMFCIGGILTKEELLNLSRYIYDF